MNFIEFKNYWQPKIDNYLQAHLSSEVEDHKISKIMSYSVQAGGKRLRPLIFLASLSALDYKISEQEVRIACGIELIHTYSLIHDDLPAMDNDDYRRGKLTSHKKWGEAEAILAGDALLPMGISWIASSNSIELIKIITEAVGPNGMVGGQYLDIASTNNASVANDNEFIERMEWLKTGCLLQASVQMAVKYAHAGQKEQQALLIFAQKFGRAYQIYDDLVDVVITSEQAGKKTHKDEASGKNNTLTLLGIKESRKELTSLITEAKEGLKLIKNTVLVGFLDLFQRVL